MRTTLTVMLLVVAAVAHVGTAPSLASALTPDGEIMNGVSASFDPAVFRMTYDSDGEPLVEEETRPWEPALPPDGKDSEGTWYPLGTGLGSTVRAIAVSGSNVYVGGYFTQAGGNPASYIARWDGSSWHPLGSGVNNTVRAIAVSGSDVYVGGHFTQAGGNPASYIARWDGSSWHPLGSGVNSAVYAIAASGSNVYVGGVFSHAGGNPAGRIAHWDGSAWFPMGSGMTGPSHTVHSIVVSGSDVYAGGEFTQAGGTTVNRIGRWDGSSWHPLGSGIGSLGVFCIVVSGSDVIVGGRFTQAGGNPANRVARWDGSSWHPLGDGVNHDVRAVDMRGSDLYVGGQFTVAGGDPTSYIARWDGSSWHPLGSGVNNTVRAIAVSGSDDYVGGNFTQAGGSPANRIARWVPLVPISVTEPNLSTQWIHFDTDLPIEWEYSVRHRLHSMLDQVTPLFGDEISIMLYRDEELVATLVTGADNTGSWIFEGPVPMSWTPGNEYRIYIEDNLGNYGWSENFSVEPSEGANVITVTEPDASTQWIHFSSDLSVEWNYPTGRRLFGIQLPLSGEEVTINLYDGTELVATLVTGADNTGSWIFEGPVPMSWTPGNEYRIFIEDNLGNYGWSDYFTIAPSEGQEVITITEPDASTIWTHFETDLPIHWEYPALSAISERMSTVLSELSDSHILRLNDSGENVAVILYDGGTPIDTLTLSTPNTGSWVFGGPVPEEWISGDEYRLYIVDDLGNYGWSQFFTLEDYVGASPESGAETHILRLFPISPNPSDEMFTIRYQVPVASHASVGVYDLSGRLVFLAADGEHASGFHQMQVGGLPSGIYFCRLQSGNVAITERFAVIR